jgi:hypothetical protein
VVPTGVENVIDSFRRVLMTAAANPGKGERTRRLPIELGVSVKRLAYNLGLWHRTATRLSSEGTDDADSQPG